jgi:hypothetical protein
MASVAMSQGFRVIVRISCTRAQSAVGVGNPCSVLSSIVLIG